jgi:two-component system response regulator MprA
MNKVLVFEDNPDIQWLLEIFFHNKGLELVVMRDGVDALAFVREQQPALIVMDVIMPGKDGIEICTELRQAGITTPIVMLTGKDSVKDRERGLKAGANVYLIKPFNPKELEKTIMSLLPS